MSKTSVRPEDILSDNESVANFNGINVRKGSIAAFLKNIYLLENAESTEEEKNAALDMIKELAPSVIAAGLHDHAIFKNTKVQEILDKEVENQHTKR